MSGSNYLLDTSIVIDALNGDSSIQQHLEETDSRIFMSVIVIGELFFGAYKSGRVQVNLESIATLLTDYRVLGCNQLTSQHYGQIKQQLMAKGRPIPENDIWIAATAVQHDFTLVTRDAHFSEITGLLIEQW
ncbi:MAG: type II toxin-antitoxin system VapC family toxin [Anaerolineae bacterium]|nr:type II toxin-antitoxin system VapC family toxin [Anaerolineae bacterium]